MNGYDATTDVVGERHEDAKQVLLKRTLRFASSGTRVRTEHHTNKPEHIIESLTTIQNRTCKPDPTTRPIAPTVTRNSTSTEQYYRQVLDRRESGTVIQYWGIRNGSARFASTSLAEAEVEEEEEEEKEEEEVRLGVLRYLRHLVEVRLKSSQPKFVCLTEDERPKEDRRAAAEKCESPVPD
ncbi:hypothetical protein Mp_5g20380 [Marchantia polymorpha subsp. ruderalis]|uniref:Uncharacterized protein n=2 Tax=Marchantia polymorpha TaxID=3197 RepID=A0AAF6BKD6_MARPO|nr:hypothetical protein MARPO_0058s0016 [Marchantia polymorpha]BBN12470.1 hypothetical protein Mp_5g20380 [Marchantia polymorpha subsp. ruderalis]|eukprot:PTQ37224.1 hypothetical protein MARPO_0058s0016 [Marchantia polymorpha]